MSEQVTVATDEQAATRAKKKSWRDVVEMVSYNGIVRNVPFLLYLAVLCVLYIANGSRAVALTRTLTQKNKELKELRWQYLDIQSRLMYATSESQLTKKAESLGLKPLEKPAFEVKVIHKVKDTND
jgi:hypothetical protein